MANLRAGSDALEREGLHITAKSHVYQTEPQGGAVGQQDFLNACIRVEADLTPGGLLAVAKRIEVELGRDTDAPRYSPRPLDVDVLIVEGERVAAPDLQIPHPEIEHRRFVLEPLLELDPPERSRLERALAALEGQRVTRLGTL
jgi:2-amino-4-hydroxy-6-hydroxymethyldihydropteridine diphosphokinase